MNKIILILENIRSVQNTASLFRTADCFGISKILLCGTTPSPIDRFGRERKDFIKISLGSEKTIHWAYSTKASDAIKQLKKEGVHIISLEQADGSTLLHKMEVSHNSMALVLGNEVTGISKECLSYSDEIIEIEQLGEKESLNVSIAGAIALYHLRFLRAPLL